jgi:hypothetical protein
VLAERLVEACQGARTVVAYNAPFERSCIERVADAVPRHAGPLGRIRNRLVNLLPIVRNHIYHPDFGGSFSLKKVVPALVADLRYDGLVVGDGQSASLELVRLLFHGSSLEGAARGQLRRDLQRCCYLDTWGLAKLLERLHDLVPWSRSSGRTGQ